MSFRRVLSAAAALVLACGCSSSSGSSSGAFAEWPADAALRAKFEKQRTDFEKLISMSNAEPKLWQITPGFARVDDFHPGRTPRAATEVDLPKARYTDYREIFRKLGLPNGLLREKAVPPAEQIFFPVYVKQMGSDDSVEKGFAYCECELPEHTGAELTLAEAQAKKPGPVFQRLEPGQQRWYLYARYNE